MTKFKASKLYYWLKKFINLFKSKEKILEYWETIEEHRGKCVS